MVWCSQKYFGLAPLVLNQVIDGIRQAGVPARDIIMFSRYVKEIQDAGIDKWLPDGVRWTAPTPDYSEFQLDMDNYDRDRTSPRW
jgi:hypothetical protein